MRKPRYLGNEQAAITIFNDAETSEDSDIFVIGGSWGYLMAHFKRVSGNGSTTGVALELGIPIILVIDASSQAQSVAAPSSFLNHDKRLNCMGVILNEVGGQRHGKLLKSALSDSGIKVLGTMPSSSNLNLPSRHRGLVQADEIHALEQFIPKASKSISSNVDLYALSKKRAKVVFQEFLLRLIS